MIGVKTKNRLPILPPIGVSDELLDDIQLKIFQYCNKIEPRYIPKVEIVEYQGANLVYLKCAAGDAEPDHYIDMEKFATGKFGQEDTEITRLESFSRKLICLRRNQRVYQKFCVN